MAARTAGRRIPIMTISQTIEPTIEAAAAADRYAGITPAN